MMFYVENLHTKERGERRLRRAEIGGPSTVAARSRSAHEMTPGSTTSPGARGASR